MTIKTPAAPIAVGTTAAQLSTFADANQGFEGGYVRSVAVFNDGAAVLYVGGPDVTAAGGIPVAPGGDASFDLGPSDELYGICAASASTTVRALTTGV